MPNSLLACLTGEPLDKITHSFVDVGPTSVLVSLASPFRRMLTVQNDGGNDVYLMFGNIAQAHQGIRLNANGGTMSFLQCHSTLCNVSLFAINSANKVSRLLISEGS